MKALITILVAALFAARAVFAFPEMVRHGYTSCAACHVSPNGGGILTPYGRSLSQEILSTWHSDHESDFMWGAVHLPNWLNLGGDFRSVQTYLDTPKYREGKFIVMQADAEAAVSYQKFELVGTLGKSDNFNAQSVGDALVSHRHYLIYHANDTLTIRAGRFFPAYGILTPDHIIPTRQGLGWDEDRETYNIEGSWSTDNYDVFVTAILGRLDEPSYDREKGFALRPSLNLGDSYKVGLSYYYGFNSQGHRHLVGPYGILGFTRHFYLLAEGDFQNDVLQNMNNTWGWVDYLRLDYELIQGFHVYAMNEISRLDFDQPNSLLEGYGVGVQFFPRPHIEVEALYEKQKVADVDPNSFNDFAWLMMHLYL